MATILVGFSRKNKNCSRQQIKAHALSTPRGKETRKKVDCDEGTNRDLTPPERTIVQHCKIQRVKRLLWTLHKMSSGIIDVNYEEIKRRDQREGMQDIPVLLG